MLNPRARSTERNSPKGSASSPAIALIRSLERPAVPAALAEKFEVFLRLGEDGVAEKQRLTLPVAEMTHIEIEPGKDMDPGKKLRGRRLLFQTELTDCDEDC